jgi:hypothetical protein
MDVLTETFSAVFQEIAKIKVKLLSEKIQKVQYISFILSLVLIQLN